MERKFAAGAALEKSSAEATKNISGFRQESAGGTKETRSHNSYYNRPFWSSAVVFPGSQAILPRYARNAYAYPQLGFRDKNLRGGGLPS